MLIISYSATKKTDIRYLIWKMMTVNSHVWETLILSMKVN